MVARLLDLLVLVQKKPLLCHKTQYKVFALRFDKVLYPISIMKRFINPKLLITGLFFLFATLESVWAQTFVQNTQLHLQVAPEITLKNRLQVFGNAQIRTFFNPGDTPSLNSKKASNIINSSYFYSLSAGAQGYITDNFYVGGQYERYQTGFDEERNLNNQAFVGWLGHRGKIGKIHFVKQLIGHFEVKERDLDKMNRQVAFHFGISRAISLGGFGVLQPGVSVLFGKIISINDNESDPLINQIIPQAYLGYQINQRINIGAMVGTDRFINTVQIGNTKESRVYSNPFVGVLLRFTFTNDDDVRNKYYNPWGYRGYMLRNPVF
jgi:hypothetical protein